MANQPKKTISKTALKTINSFAKEIKTYLKSLYCTQRIRQKMHKKLTEFLKNKLALDPTGQEPFRQADYLINDLLLRGKSADMVVTPSKEVLDRGPRENDYFYAQLKPIPNSEYYSIIIYLKHHPCYIKHKRQS